MYCARGALFNTMETVAGENPLALATSRIVTALPLSPSRFMPLSLWPASSGNFGSDCNGELINKAYSAGASNESGSRNHLVFHTPYAIPAAIHTLPRIFAGAVRLHQSPPHMKNPKTGGKKFTNFFSAP